MPVEQTEDFLAAIRAANVLPADRADDLAAWAERVRPTPHVLAAEIDRRGWLTGYQIKEVYHGRGGELTLGPYILLDLIGVGGMGRVFKAHHTRLGRDVALKVIRKEKVSRPAVVKRFKQEIAAAAKLSHPNVVLALDADEVNGIHFFAMEYVEGTDLTKLVQRHGAMPPPQACDAVRQAAVGLQHAHEQGLVHRDVKPSNLLLTPRGQVKVLDLGLAMLNTTEDPDAARVTQEGLVLGTPDFLAPEQARNPLGVDGRADVYALGATLFYLLTGRVPFDGESAADKLIQHCTAPVPSVRTFRPELPPQFDGLIQWMMAKRPDDRPQTPAQVAAALAPYCVVGMAVTTTGAPMPVPVAPAPSWQGTPSGTQPVPFPDEALLFNEPAPQLAPRDPQPLVRGTYEPRRGSGIGLKVLLFLAAGLFVLAVVGVVGYILYDSLIGTPPPTADFTNSVGQKMVRLQGGSFVMGSPDHEVGRDRNESPAGDVTVSGPFFVSATEVTNAQYVAGMGKSKATWPGKMRKSADVPEDSVTWEEATEFCRKLTAKEVNRATGWGYRLPTEAEWEYACRAGTATPFWGGDKLVLGRHGFFDLERETDEKGALGVADEGLKVEKNLPHAVGTSSANPFGLFDTHGNVWEWVQDYYAPGYDGRSSVDPKGPATGDWRVLRGGSWREPASACRSAARKGASPTTRAEDVGFRVVYAPLPK